MLVIKRKQINELTELIRDRFEKNSLIHLKGKFPILNKESDVQTEKIIKQGIAAASRYKITTRKETLQFLEYIFAFGQDFELKPEHLWAKKILYIRNLSGKEKIARMLKKRTP